MHQSYLFKTILADLYIYVRKTLTLIKCFKSLTSHLPKIKELYKDI